MEPITKDLLTSDKLVVMSVGEIVCLEDLGKATFPREWRGKTDMLNDDEQVETEDAKE